MSPTSQTPIDPAQPDATSFDDLQTMFLRNVQHELRTPLTIIQGYVELLNGGELGQLAPEQEDALFVVADRVHRLRTLIERISILMAVEAASITRQPVCLQDLVEAAADRYRPLAQAAGHQLDVQVQPDLPIMLGDSALLAPMLDCLVENAFKFTPSGGRVELSLGLEGDLLCVAISDTGIGMALDQVENLLRRPFYQVDDSMRRRYEGFGLGMTLVRVVVNAHDGRLAIDSEPGRGSRFATYFSPAPEKSEDDSVLEQTVRRRRVLVVDDEEIVAMALQEGLSKLSNCEVSMATSGEQALVLFEEQPFDLLITDYRMPGTDGMTLAARIRERFPRTVIVMITAYGDHELRAQASRASILRILDKPVAFDEIRRVALDALESSNP